MTLLRYFFSPNGRFKRLTFWEGLVAWVLLNTLILMIEVAILSFPVDDYLVRNLGDAEHVIYYFLGSSLIFLHWVFAIWTLIAVCAKRWHDLNYPGWLAVVNIIPVVCVGLAILTYLGSVDRDAIRHLITDPHVNVFGIFSSAFHDYKSSFLNIALLTSACSTIGSFIYLGFFKGNSGANGYGKHAA